MKYILSIILLTFSVTAFSQVKLEGVIKDSLGSPLELANVIAINKATKSLDSYSITNDDGVFRLDLKKEYHLFYSSQLHRDEVFIPAFGN